MMKNYLVIHRRETKFAGEGFENLLIVQAQTHEEAAAKSKPGRGLLVTTVEVDGEPWQYYTALRDDRERNMMP